MKWLTMVLVGALMLGCGESSVEGDETGESNPDAPSGDVPDVPAGPVDTSIPGDAQAGEAIFVANCQACHGADGRGNGGVGGDFVGEPERLQQDNGVLLARIADGITGGRSMPPQRDLLTEEERRDALSYIRQAFGSEE